MKLQLSQQNSTSSDKKKGFYSKMFGGNKSTTESDATIKQETKKAIFTPSLDKKAKSSKCYVMQRNAEQCLRNAK